jgi:hypothetical protein
MRFDMFSLIKISQCALGKERLVVHREHQHGQLRFFRANVLRQLNAVRAPLQPDVHHGEVELVFADGTERFVVVARFRPHLEVRLVVQQLHDAFAEKRMIVDHEHASLGWLLLRLSVFAVRLHRARNSISRAMSTADLSFCTV